MADNPDSKKYRLFVFAVAALMVMGNLIFFSAYLYQQRADSLKRSQQDLEYSSRSLALYMDTSIQDVDLVLRAVTDQVADRHLIDADQMRKKLSTQEVFEILNNRKAGIPQLSVVSIVDKSGNTVNSTRNVLAQSNQGARVNLFERDYFQAHLADPALELFISSPVQNKGTGTWTFYLTRKILNPSGEMIGLVR